MNSDKLFVALGSARFWLWWDVFFALSNLVFALVADEGWPRLLNAWCAIVLVVCAVSMWYRIEEESAGEA